MTDCGEHGDYSTTSRAQLSQSPVGGMPRALMQNQIFTTAIIKINRLVCGHRHKMSSP